ncbi:outer membrane beta-barrel protein [Aestuariivivens sp. NBU2969]|uniref:outer membrane beta-barrel protein n=1 Tax=Aestuariivivens sp. NBU2969 TaxID=2873267 RepID=UPI001CC18C42|nr:outer membrane beta-barrel family protein [Aestuariivivens sp. NBU2969]
MQLKLFVFAILFSIFWGEAQELQIKGSVKDSNNNYIAFANVVITSSLNTNFLEGTTTDETGRFKFNQLVSGIYSLEISYLGYKTENVSLELKKDTTLQAIVLKEDPHQLEGVTVIAKRPSVKRLVDRLVFNVENSTLSNNNVLDVLKHTPGVIVSDGKITVKHSTPVIYINNKRIHLSINEVQQLLEGTTATNLKSIEVITNPPAKYDAEGGAVINIVTSKNIISGYNGSIFGNYKQGSEYPKYSFGTSHFFKGEKLSTYINFSDSPKKEYRNNNEFINFFNSQGEKATNWETDYRRIRKTSNKKINTNIDYEIDDRNSLGFSTNLLIAPRESTKTLVNSTTEVFDANKVLDSSFTTDNRLVDETFNLAFTLDYIHKFKKEGEKLSVSAHHTNYDFSSFQNVDTDYWFPDNSLIRNNRFQTFSSQVIKLFTGQLDYHLPLNETCEFEAGTKISNINSESILNQYIFKNGNKEEDQDNSDTFLYDEFNYAAYMSYSKDWREWSLKTGLRAEYTNIKGNSMSTNQINNNDYFKIFPSIYLLNRINENNELYFNYKKRIYRPRYSQLNPFKYFLNDNAFITGDPSLKPQIDDTFTLGYTFFKDFTFEIYYRIENDPTLEIVFQDNEENILKYSNTNIDKSISYGLDFMTYTQLTNRWNLYVLSSLFYYENQFFAIESNNQLFAVDQWSVYANLINYITLLKDKSLDLEVSYLYISPLVDGPTKVGVRSGLNINLRKTFWNNRASFNIGVQDVFNTQNFATATKYLNQDISFRSKMENKLLTLGFNYKFGNFRLKETKRNVDLEERDRL